MFVQPILGAGENIDTVLKNKEPQIKEVLQVIKTLCLAASIKIDGFVMVKPSEVEAL
jgi:hypothetical protein